ncbi:MAG: phosphatase PAP2 family protein [Bacteroidales bacterium]|nr:phosphatase PAP2 family protein [Bacteroidales bacterium]
MAVEFFLLQYTKDQIHIYLNQFHNPILNILFKYITHLGSGYFTLLIVLLFLFIKYKNSVILFISFISSGIIVQFLKNFVYKDSVRPAMYFSNKYELQLVPGVEMYYANSYPSGHTATAFALFICLAFMTKNRLIKHLYFLLAVIVGYSRIYLSQHFLSDVLFGSVIGFICAFMTCFYVNRKNNSWLEASLLKNKSNGQK